MPTAAEIVEQIDTLVYRLQSGPPVGGSASGEGGPAAAAQQPSPDQQPGEPPIEWAAGVPGGDYCPPGQIVGGVLHWLVPGGLPQNGAAPVDPETTTVRLRGAFPSDAEILAIAALARAVGMVDLSAARRVDRVLQALGVSPGFDQDVTAAIGGVLASAPAGEVINAARVASGTPRLVVDAIAAAIARATSRPRKPLVGLSSVGYQHPADRAVQSQLMAVPVLGSVVAWFAGFWKRSGELSQLGQAFEVTAASLPAVHKAYREACDVLQVELAPRLFVSGQGFTPGAVGMISSEACGVDQPYILLGQVAAGVLDPAELTFLLGRELGHVAADHVKYRSLAKWLHTTANVAGKVTAGLADLLSNITLRPLLATYYRRTALTADRAGLLACQSREVALRVLMKQSGFPMRNYHEMKTRSLIEQAIRHHDEAGGTFLDRLLHLQQQFDLANPWVVHRASELLHWIDDGGFAEIVDATKSQRLAMAKRLDSDPQMQALIDKTLRGMTDWATSRFRGKRSEVARSVRGMVYEQVAPAGGTSDVVLRVELVIVKQSASVLEYTVAILFVESGKPIRATLTLEFPSAWDDAPATVREDFIRYGGTKVVRLLYPTSK